MCFFPIDDIAVAVFSWSVLFFEIFLFHFLLDLSSFDGVHFKYIPILVILLLSLHSYVFLFSQLRSFNYFIFQTFLLSS